MKTNFRTFTSWAVIPLLMTLILGCTTPRPTARPSASPPATRQGNGPGGKASPCGDQVCDAAEQANPNLCPQDCRATAPPTLAPTVSPMPASTPGGQPPSPPPTSQPQGPPPSGHPQGQPTPGDPGSVMYANQLPDPLPQEAYLAHVNATTEPQSGWTYLTTLVATMPSGTPYDVGGFCRIFPRPDGNGYDVLFGGAFQMRTTEAARYEGDVHRRLGNDLTFQTDAELFSTHGGDVAFDTDGQYYYVSTPRPEGWTLSKYDENFNLVKEVVVALPDGHAGNDQMLRVWNGQVYLSGLYNPNPSDAQPGQEASPDEVLYTHMWVYDTDLNPLEDHILDDAPNINGGTLIRYDEGFAYVAADNFLNNNLYAHLYDANWNYQRSVLLEENAQWSMGGTVADGLIYIAYHRGEHSSGDVLVDIFDPDWNRLDQIQVTAVTGDFNAQRPWVQVYGDRLFVSYDVGRDRAGILDLQCLISVYTRDTGE